MTDPTPNLVLTYSPQDANLAGRLEKDLQAANFTVQPVLSGERRDILIALISPAGSVDQSVQNTIIQALDNGQHIIPLLIGPAMLPKLINHLKSLDFGQGYPLNALLDRIAAVSSPDAGLPLKVLTPSARRKNSSTAYWLAILAVIWFVIGIVAVGVFGIQMPADEYNNVDTEVAATINVYVDQNLPRSTEDAINFPATIQAAPTAQRPFLIATATAMAAPK